MRQQCAFVDSVQICQTVRTFRQTLFQEYDIVAVSYYNKAISDKITARITATMTYSNV